MADILPFEEIKARYAPDWVLMGDVTIRESDTTLVSGRVLYHTPDHDEVWEKALELRLDHLAVRYLGSWPEDMEFVL